MYYTVEAKLKGTSGYSPSRLHDTPRTENEDHDKYDQRTWREHCHTDATGRVFIPGISFAQGLESAAKYVSMKVAGQGGAKFTQKFRSAVQCSENLVLSYAKDDAHCETILAHATGVRGSGKRVTRRFPIFPEWGGTLTMYVLDPIITEEILLQHLDAMGKFIGIGRFRPQNGGFNGRFVVEKVTWTPRNPQNLASVEAA